VLALFVMQRVVKARHHARCVAEGGMLGDVLDALAIDENGAIVTQRLEIFFAILRPSDLSLADLLRRRRGRRVLDLRLSRHDLSPAVVRVAN
jgi:hypothetical protein